MTVASRHGHTALPRQRDAGPILRSRAGQARYRKAKKVWPSGHRTKDSMAVRPPDQRQYGRPATGPPLCKGSCRRRPTEGLTQCLRFQVMLLHRAESFTRLYNPPCMALPCCPPFAQGGLWCCRTRQLNESWLYSLRQREERPSRHWAGSAVWERGHPANPP